MWGRKSAGINEGEGWEKTGGENVKKQSSEDEKNISHHQLKPLISVLWHLVVWRRFINLRHEQITALTVQLVSMTLSDTNGWRNKLHFQQPTRSRGLNHVRSICLGNRVFKREFCFGRKQHWTHTSSLRVALPHTTNFSFYYLQTV